MAIVINSRAGAIDPVANWLDNKGKVTSSKGYSHIPVVAGGTDPYFSSVTLLMHCEGVSGSQAFVDSSQYAFTGFSKSGGVSLTDVASKFGTTSLNAKFGAMDAGGGPKFNFTNNDWTIEAWVYPIGSTGGGIFGYCAGAIGFYSLDITSSRYVRFSAKNMDGTVITYLVSTEVLVANDWSHIAVQRKAGVVSIFINGILSITQYTTNLSNAYVLGSNYPFCIGTTRYGESNFWGYIDEFRVTTGVARYSGNFAVPTAAYPNE